VIQNGHVPVTWTQFVPTLSCGSGLPLTSIVVGPDHNVWLADPCGGLIRMTMAGVVTERLFNNFHPTQIAVGADRRFYMTQQGTSIIGISDMRGKLQTYSIPSGDTIYDGGITLGPDGNVWFVESLHVGKITPTGTITEYLDFAQAGPNKYAGVTTGADGHIWVPDAAVPDQGLVLDIDPATGHVGYETFNCLSGGPIIPMTPPSPYDVWYFCTDSTFLAVENGSDKYNRYQVAWPIAGRLAALPQAMIAGPKGDPWWASTGGAIVAFDPRSNSVTAYLPPDQTDSTDAIALGPDGNIWGATAKGKVDVYIINVLAVKPSSLKFTGLGQQQTLTVSERGRQSWSASSSDTSVATVAPGSTGSQFVVTSVGDGTCTVTVSDDRRNSFPVAVRVGQALGRSKR
jgi:streptogramin lyase